KARVLGIHKDVDVLADVALLRQDAIDDAGMLGGQGGQRITYGANRLREPDRRSCSCVLLQRRWNLDGDHDEPSVAAFTQVMAGNPSAISFQLSPSFADPKSLPLRVPKYTPALE